MMRSATSVAILVGMAVMAACRGGAPPEAATPGANPKRAPATGAGADRNACHLLGHDEVSALAERKVLISDQTEAGESYSTCEWEDADRKLALGITVHWSGGKEQWQTWRLAQGLGDAVLKQAEGVTASAVVKQGLVPGIGDAAFFSPVLPSLILKGDTLIEINLALVPGADTKFTGLAAKLLTKIG